MRFEDLNWFDVESYLEKDDRLMIVLGSCEQHAYLSLLTDVKIPLAIAEAASKKSGVLLAPPVNFGISPYFLAYPGTISLRVSTLVNVVEDLVKSVHGSGFRNLLFLNGHGGNHPAREVLFELSNQLSGLRTGWYSWFDSHSVQQILLDHDLKGNHASWFEAFSFTRVAELPREGKTPPHVPYLANAEETRKIYQDGSFGGRYQVEPSIMEEIFFAAVEDVVKKLQFGEDIE